MTKKKTIKKYCYERNISLKDFSREQGRCDNWASNLQYKRAYILSGKLYSARGNLLEILEPSK